MGGKISKERIIEISAGQIFEIGDFRIKVLPGKHAPHIRFVNFTSTDNNIEEPLKTPASYNEYSMGENFNFYLHHPSAEIVLSEKDKNELDAGLVIQGIANRVSTKNLIENVFKPFNVKIIMPVHSDNFFRPLSEGPKPFIFSRIGEFKKTVFHSLPDTKILELNYGEK